MSELNKELETKAVTILDEAKSTEITTQEQYDKSAEFLKSVKQLQKKIKEHYADPIKKAYEAHKAIKAAEQELLKPLDEAETIIKKKCGSFNRQQEEIRAEKERQLREEAKKKAEEEAAKKNAENAFMAEILDQPVAEIVPVIVPEVVIEKPKNVSGTYYVESWKFKIIDENLIPREYLMIDESKIGKVVKAMKSLTNIPGIETYSENEMRTRV